MHLHPVLDSLYTLSSLWGALAGASVCPSGSDTAWAFVPRAQAAVTAFVKVNVIPMDTERVLINQTVLVEGGKITALGPVDQVKVPAGAVRIDGKGKYLIPGLGTMHPHGRLDEAKLQEPDMQNRLFWELAMGVTTMRQMIGGALTPEQLRRHVETAEIPSPRMYISPKIPRTDRSVPFRLDSVAMYIAAAKAAGYHHIGLELSVSKMIARDAQTLAFLDSIVAAARRVGLPVADHSHFLPYETILALGTTGGSVEHLTAYLTAYWWGTRGFKFNRLQDSWDTSMTDTDLRALAATAQRAGLWITPTLQCSEGRAVSPAHIKVLRQFVKTLQDAGVGLFLAGDDGWDVHDELTALVRAGLTPYQALITGTRNVAQYLRLQDSSGTVAVGKWADLVLLSGNPLADIRHTREPAGVMLAGRWLDRAALDQRLLASNKWFEEVLRSPGVLSSLAEEPRNALLRRVGKFQTLTDSLAGATPKSAEAEQALRRLAEELGAMRASLTPAQYETFDPIARVWLREWARQGSRVTVPGVIPTP